MSRGARARYVLIGPEGGGRTATHTRLTTRCMAMESAREGDAGFAGVEIVAIDLARSEPPGRKILELSAMEIARSDHPPLGGVVFLLDREPPEGWFECLQVAEAELGYEGPYVSKVNGRALELEYDPERFDERFRGLKVALANANEQYRRLLAERAEQRRRVEEVESAYRARIAAAAEKLGIPTVSD